MGKIKTFDDKVVVEMSMNELVGQPAFFMVPKGAEEGRIGQSHIGNLIIRAVWEILFQKDIPASFNKAKVTGGKVTITFEREE